MAYQTEMIVNTQPQMTVTSYSMTAGSSNWSSELCDCCEDCGICLCGTFLPCILGCKVAQDHGDSCCLPFLPGAMIAVRTSMRDRYNIQGTICDDWIAVACFPLCAVCQMAREQKARGV